MLKISSEPVFNAVFMKLSMRFKVTYERLNPFFFQINY